MSAARKTGWTLTGAVAGAALVFGLWDKVVPVLEWLAPIFGRESVQAVGTGWLVAALTLPLPWVLPKQMTPIWTRSVAALVSSSASIATIVLLTWPLTRTDVVYAFGLGLFGPIAINSGLVHLYLHLRPNATPESLQK